MKKMICLLTLANICMVCFSQNTVKGSLRQGTAANSVDIVYLPNHSNTGEYVNYLSISIAIDTTGTSAVTPSIAGVGNFASFTFTQASPFSYTWGNQRIFSWISLNTSVTSMSWTNNTQFTGATITFTGGNDSLKIKLVDLSNAAGGSNGNTYYAYGVNVSPFDLVDYNGIFFSISGTNGSTTNTFANGDQYAETSLRIHLKDFSSGRMAMPSKEVKQQVNSIKLFSNPTNSHLKVSVSSTEAKLVTFVVFDLSGKVVRKIPSGLQAGNNLVTVNTSGLPAGNYLLSLTDKSGKIETVQFSRQ